MNVGGCACGGVNCPHCNPNLWLPPVTLGNATLQALTDRIKELEKEAKWEPSQQIHILADMNISLVERLETAEKRIAELEEVRGELESLIQFTRSEIRKLPAEYVHEKQHSSRALLGGEG